MSSVAPGKYGSMIVTFWSEENPRERLDYRSNPGEAEIGSSPCDWFSRHLTMERVPAARRTVVFSIHFPLDSQPTSEEEGDP